MKRFALPLFAMAIPTSVLAQDAGTGEWAGYYAGVQIDVLTGGDFSFEGVPAVTGDYEGFLYDFFIGHRWQFGRFVVGGEYDLAFGQPEVTLTGLFTVSSKPTIHRIGGEFGFDAGRVLPYATAGYSFINFDAEAGTNSANGPFFGVGLDYRLNESTTIGFEYLHHDYGELSLIPGLSTELDTFGMNFAVEF
ncbi:outer membrane beta-barrel protein [Rhodobacterales bacterium HKCCE3408]|nr:outer membrane beta-barrel protein [Rhodobacterales bacterium HKCCE3408]